MKMTNEEKAKIICDCDHCNACHKYSKGSYCYDFTCDAYNDVMNAMKWKDEQFKELLESELKNWRLCTSSEAKYRREMLEELIEKLNE